MKVIIDIPEEKYNTIKNKMYCGIYDAEVYEAIANGIPLPKGHGRLVDADDAKREWQNILDCEIEHPRYQCTIRDVLEDAPTIIEADKER